MNIDDFSFHVYITDNIRVSTAALRRDNVYHGEEYFLIETWCFSKDKRQRSFQSIIGTPSFLNSYWYDKTLKVHCNIADNLLNKFKNEETTRLESVLKIKRKVRKI